MAKEPVEAGKVSWRSGMGGELKKPSATCWRYVWRRRFFRRVFLFCNSDASTSSPHRTTKEPAGMTTFHFPRRSSLLLMSCSGLTIRRVGETCGVVKEVRGFLAARWSVLSGEVAAVPAVAVSGASAASVASTASAASAASVASAASTALVDSAASVACSNGASAALVSAAAAAAAARSSCIALGRGMFGTGR